MKTNQLQKCCCVSFKSAVILSLRLGAEQKQSMTHYVCSQYVSVFSTDVRAEVGDT